MNDARLEAVLTATVDSVVSLTLTVANPASSPATIGFSSSQRYDFLAVASQGASDWRWADGQMFAQMLGAVTLAPGEALVFTERWRAAPGSYRVTGRLTSTTHRAEATIVVTVP